MKIFVLTDLHGRRAILPAIDRFLSKHKIGAVFMLGDLCDRNDENALSYASDFINSIIVIRNIPLYAIHGNNEPDSVKLLYQQKDISVHFNPKVIPTLYPTSGVGYKVVGVGYGDVFPNDPQFAKGKILLTHEPPRANSLRQMESIELPNAPLIHFAGHLHTIAQIRQLKSTTFVQVPSAMFNRCAILELPSKIIRFVNF